MGDEFLDAARERFRRLIGDMPARERAAFIAKIMADAAFAPEGPLARDLMPALHATIDALSAQHALDPAALASEAFRRHGYHAELVDRGDVALFRVDPMGG